MPVGASRLVSIATVDLHLSYVPRLGSARGGIHGSIKGGGFSTKRPHIGGAADVPSALAATR